MPPSPFHPHSCSFTGSEFCCFRGNIIAKGGLHQEMGALFVVLQIISLENHTVENISIQDQWLLIINDQLPTKITPVKYKTKVSNVPTNFWADAYILNQKQTLNNVQEAIFFC